VSRNNNVGEIMGVVFFSSVREPGLVSRGLARDVSPLSVSNAQPNWSEIWLVSRWSVHWGSVCFNKLKS